MNCPKCKSEIAPGLKKCPECGRRIKSAVTRLEPMDGRSDIPALELTKSEVVIGRLGDNDLILPGDSSVSRHHAHIRRQGDHYSIEDNKSRHGVEVNGQKIISSFRLKAGDVVTIGKFRFRFVTPQTSVSASVTSPEVEVDHLRLLFGCHQAHQFSRGLEGRSGACDRFCDPRNPSRKRLPDDGK